MTHKDLVLESFKKANSFLVEKGVPTPSKTSVAELLSDYIDQECDFQFGERRLRDYYNEALKNEVVEVKQQAVRDGLAKYLGHKDFRDFLITTTEIETNLEDKTHTQTGLKGNSTFISNFIKRNRTTVLIIIGCLIAFLFFNTITKEKWMVWDGNRYVETDFNSHKVKNREIFLYNDNQVAHFKKIQVSCDTQFFNTDGNARFWYGKNRNGNLEYFTELGKHPETGKTLKPITQYMIDKYICR